MKKSIAALIILACAGIYYLLGMDCSKIFLSFDTQLSENLMDDVKGAWFIMAHTSYNTFVTWRWDALLAYLAEYVLHFTSYELNVLPRVYNFVCLFVSVVCSFFMFLQVRPKNIFGAVLSSIIWCIVLAAGWGADTIIISSFVWLPLFIICCIRFFLAQSKFYWFYFLLCLFFAYRISVTANQLSILIILSGIGIAIFLTQNSLKKSQLYLSMTFLIPALICLLSAPVPPNLDYPHNIDTHVVSDDGLPGMIRPLIGPESLDVPTVDRPFIKDVFTNTAYLLLLFLVLMGMPSAWRTKYKTLFGWTLLGTILLFLDVVCGESISHIMPIAVINRMIPHLFFFTLTPIVVALTFFVLLIHLRFTAFEFSGVIIALCLLPNLQNPVWQSPIAQRAKSEFSSMTREDQIKNEKYLVSPSLHILNSFGLWILDRNKPERMVDVAKLDPDVTFEDSRNSSPEELAPLKDRDWNTRWSIKQQTNEWLLVKLSHPQTLRAIEPTPSSRFYTDFPRGIRIAVADDCALPINKYRIVFEMPLWQGELLFSPQGYPYFGNHSLVRIKLKEAVTAKCWLIEKIGKPSDFDWSVAKIKVGLADGK